MKEAELDSRDEEFINIVFGIVYHLTLRFTLIIFFNID